MSGYVEYSLDDGTTILVEVDQKRGGVVPASRTSGEKETGSKKKFTDALSSMRGSIKAMVKELNEMEIDEADIVFGIKATGEAGIFAVSKFGSEVNYQITIKWKRQP